MLLVAPELGFVIPAFVVLPPISFLSFRAYGLLSVLAFLRVQRLCVSFVRPHSPQRFCFILAIISKPPQPALQLPR
jgi:hypothetical protein